jgi:hypothetical protein
MDESAARRGRILAEIDRLERDIAVRRLALGADDADPDLARLQEQWLDLQSDLASVRAHPRLPLRVAAWILLRGVKIAAHTKDVSRGGLCLRTFPDRFERGDDVEIDVARPGGGEPLRFPGVVAWVRGDILGVAFESAAHKHVTPLLHAAIAEASSGLDDIAARLRKEREDGET